MVSRCWPWLLTVNLIFWNEQISRWKKCAHERSGRWLRVYLGKCLKAELDHIPQNPKDEKVSPVIRQVLQHWGLAVNDDVYERFKAEKGKK